MGEIGTSATDAMTRLAALLPAAPATMTIDELLGFAASVEEVGRQIDGLRLWVAQEIDNRSDASLGDDSLARRLGARTVADAVERVTRTSHADAFRRVKLARALRRFPTVAQAVTDGCLGREQLDAILPDPLLRAAGVAHPEDVSAAESALVESAQTLPADAVRLQAQTWAVALDPDGLPPREDDALERRFFTIGRDQGGLAKISGLMPVEQAATLRSVIDAYVNPKGRVEFSDATGGGAGDEVADRDRDRDLGLDPDGAAGADAPKDLRTAAQKRADVVHAVFAAQARAAEVPTMGGAHPTLLVTVTEAELRSGSGAAWVDGEDEPISIAAARQLACTGGEQRVVFGDDGEVLHLGRTARVFSPAQRRAIAARDRGCVIPGCGMPARWCEVHHATSWCDGGQTEVGNGVLLCWFHHRQVDAGPWQVRMSGGVPQVRWVLGRHSSEWAPARGAPPPVRSRR
ncbi:HNH endonuclease signature motif containing protein [Gryllotalpicola ginsengisoli]|uniref:HNH endonuclease signature motif containing protein n=1 Tax=Gryllotalpicola ginsengisoli TaxID=444608 RepID=UPI0003B46BE0|nr:HNH endonuclease signature motif containing protein [Gryllotalpicola ginsengisoli]